MRQSLRRAARVLGAAASLAVPLVAVPLAGAAATVPLVFPTSRGFVPLAVAGAFMLPAVVAAMFVALARFGRVLGPVLGVCVLAITVLALVGLSLTGFLPPLRS